MTIGASTMKPSARITAESAAPKRCPRGSINRVGAECGDDMRADLVKREPRGAHGQVAKEIRTPARASRMTTEISEAGPERVRAARPQTSPNPAAADARR